MSKTAKTPNKNKLIVKLCLLIFVLFFVRSSQGTYSLKNGELYSMINNLVSVVIFITIIVIVIKLLMRKTND